MTDKADDFFAHYGIPGMKWGKRKASGAIDSVKSKRAESTAKKVAKSDAIKNMSDAELRSKINRIQMEKQYSQLTTSSGTTAAGKKMATDLLANATKQVAADYVKKGVTLAVKAAVSAAVKR